MTRTRRIERHAQGLLWYPDLGYGYYPVVQDGQYGEDYWRLYQGYRGSPIADALMRARFDLVERHAPRAELVDIGVGSGHFIEYRERALSGSAPDGSGGTRTYGYDVNPVAVAWLRRNGLWWDPYERPPENASCWDSLEHMDRPEEFVRRVRRRLFVSIPIFTGPEHAVRSKHFKPREHYWYFTRDGLVAWMESLGFALETENRMETELGREDIGTFVFGRLRPDDGDRGGGRGDAPGSAAQRPGGGGGRDPL